MSFQPINFQGRADGPMGGWGGGGVIYFIFRAPPLI